MMLLRPLAILLALVVSDLHCLPSFVNVSESQGPGTILWSFSFNCSSHTPTLKLLQVQPPSTFFNPPSLARWQGLYVGQLTLSSSAQLDALAVNHYELQLQVNITSAQDPPHFPGPFSINGQGWLQAPPQGLRGQAPKVSMTGTWGCPWPGHTMGRATTSWRLACSWPPGPPT
ncbi:Cadherin-related family member 4 [Myotis davidii]|uniref:Cadherin-related family member 4 n=1 Tax=Myotis davidii TaxID=225400 RepID=L5LGB4_MYODS|nr:Cadherin-related family member 4 [Myotis davidii]